MVIIDFVWYQMNVIGFNTKQLDTPHYMYTCVAKYAVIQGALEVCPFKNIFNMTISKTVQMPNLIYSRVSEKRIEIYEFACYTSLMEKFTNLCPPHSHLSSKNKTKQNKTKTQKI